MDFKGQLTVARLSPSALSPSTPSPPPQAAGLQGPPFPKQQREPQQTPAGGVRSSSPHGWGSA